MSDRPNIRLFVPLLLTLLLVGPTVGCGSSSSSDASAFDPGSAGSGGAGPTNDGAIDGDGGREGMGAGGNAGLPVAVDSETLVRLFADVERSPFDFLDGLGSSPQGYADAVVSCYSEARACEMTFCAPFAGCCVGTGACCAPLEDAPLPESLTFGACSGQSIEDCAAGAGYDATTFGAGTPLITSRGLVPNGTATSEGGALLGESLSLNNERVRLEAQFTPPVGCNASCLESAGVALTEDSGDGSFNGAGVGLLFSGSRQQVTLLVGDQAVDAFDSGDPASTWVLALSPDGTVEVERDAATLGVYAFDAESLGRARLALFGRSLFSNANSATIARVAATVELCDSPRGWTERVPLTVTLDGVPDPDFAAAAAPSLLDDPLSTTVAFELDGEIYIGDLIDDTIDVSSLSTPLVPSESFDAAGVAEPELVTMGDSLRLYYGAIDGSGTGSIGAATIVDGEVVKDPAPALAPDGDVSSYTSPTVRSRDGLDVLIVRAVLVSGATELRAFYTSDPGTGWTRILDGTLEALTRVDDATEDITAPSLIVHNSAYQLYYARRVGTRWTVELLTSDELLFWRSLGEALGPSGEGFDALGARGLDARSGFDEIDALYMGQGDVSFRLGRARRPAPSDTASTAF